MKKTNFFKMKLNGQHFLLLTNLFLLVVILTNFSFAKNSTLDFLKSMETTKVEDVVIKKDAVKNAISNVSSKGDFVEKSINESILSEPLIGEITMFAGNFAPRGWAFCNGQLLAISSNTALFSILGTTYGGDGRTTFGLPDLRGRVAIHAGQGAGLPNVRLGQKNNEPFVMPYFDDKYNPVLPPSTQAVNYVIAVQGIFPSRS